MAKIVSHPASMGIDEYRQHVNNSATTAKPTREKKARKPRTHSAIITAEQFRSNYVDQDEHDLQALGLEWFYLAYPQLLIIAIPNAAERSVVLSMRMIAEGLVKGAPDLYLAYPHNGQPGLFIETKTVNGTVSDAQARCHAYLRAVGYDVAIPATFEAFQKVVNDYLA